MTLLTPFSLLLLGLAIPLILMYVLKLRRQDRVISSTALWQLSVEDVQANTPWQRLRPNVLLLLQLLVLGALVLALARPAYTQEQTFTGDIIVIIDQSWAMQAHDVKPSRFIAAQAAARTLLHQLGPGNVMSVIGMSSQPKLVLAESSDRGTGASVIDKLAPANVTPNFLAALSLASSLARQGESTHVVVLTSRESGITNLPLSTRFPVKIIRIGHPLRDLGVAAFRVARVNGHTQAIATIHNFGYRSAASDLNLETDGQLEDVRPLQVLPGRDANVFWSDLPGHISRLHVHLSAPDDLRSDKDAWALVASPLIRRVLLVSNGSFFLQTALALDPSVKLDTTTPASYTAALARQFDLVVFNSFLPLNLPPTSVLLVSPPRGREGELQFDRLVPARSLVPTTLHLTVALSSLLRYVDLNDVHVDRIRQTAPVSWLYPLAVSGGSPVLAAGESGAQRLGLVAFNLEKSDWPLRVSFPIVLENFLHYLVPSLDLDGHNFQAGQPASLHTSSGDFPRITRPDGTSVIVPATALTLHDTNQLGIYTARKAGRVAGPAAHFTVSFFHPHSSVTTGPQVLSFGRNLGSRTRTEHVAVSAAWVAGLLALLVLTVEWWYGFRR